MPDNNTPDPLFPGSLAHTHKCAADHFSPWMIEEKWFRAAVEAVRNGTLQPKAFDDDEDDDDDKDKDYPGYSVVDRVAVVSITGSIMKKAGKYAGTSSVAVRAAVRKAVNDENVDSILLHIDSPGGTVAGTGDLAADVAAANQRKPVYAHIDDLGASAAYWVASQARRVTANPTGQVGSIGTVLVLDDTSGMYAAKGIKVHVISTGKFKGAGFDGAPITDEQLAMFRQEVEDLNEHFLKGVAKGRSMGIAAVRELADGRVHIAAKAEQLGLIDGVTTLDGAMSFVQAEMKKRRRDYAAAAGETVVLDEPQYETEIAEPLLEVIATGDVGTFVTTFLPDEPNNTTSTPVASTCVEAAPEQPRKEFQAMPETNTQAPPASNPAVGPSASTPGDPLREQEIAGYVERGRQLGLKQARDEERARFKAIREACSNDPKMAADAFESGQPIEAVKLAAEAAARVQRAADERLALLQEENRRQVALAANGGYSGAITLMPEQSSDQPTGPLSAEEAKAQASQEWDRNVAVRKGFSSKENYVAIRAAELRGQYGGRSR